MSVRMVDLRYAASTAGASSGAGFDGSSAARRSSFGGQHVHFPSADGSGTFAVDPAVVRAYEDAGGVPKKVSQSLHDTKRSINKAILELEKINSLHKSRRPRNEAPPDTLGYERVLEDMEVDFWDQSGGVVNLQTHPEEFGVHGNQAEVQRELVPATTWKAGIVF